MTRILTKPLVLLTATVLAATAAGATLPGATPLALGAQGGAVIPSNAEDALDRPELWDCTRIQPEYGAWLDARNAPEDFRYVGKTYRDVATDETYTWNDWLDWADDADCLPGAVPGNGLGVSTTNFLIGGAIAALGAGLLTASSGSNSKSPG